MIFEIKGQWSIDFERIRWAVRVDGAYAKSFDTRLEAEDWCDKAVVQDFSEESYIYTPTIGRRA